MSETANLCRCGRPTRDQAFTCDDCSDGLARALGDVTWLADELETTVTRQKGVDYRKVGGSSGGKKASERPSPVVWGASDARANLKAILVSWTLFCAAENVRNSSPVETLPADNLPALSRWLLWRVDGLALHDIGPDAVDEITEAVAHCHRLIDRAPDMVFAGPCGYEHDRDGETVKCPVDLYAIVGAPSIKCKTCGSVWDVKERRTWLLLMAEDMLFTAADISRAVSWMDTDPLTPARVRKWASRDRILVRGHDREDRPLYRVGDAIDLLAKTARPGDVA